MSEISRKISLNVDEDCYSLIEEYSSYVNESERKILSRLLNYSLKEYAHKYINLKQGYQEMAKTNLEISKAFRLSENEAFNRIYD